MAIMIYDAGLTDNIPPFDYDRLERDERLDRAERLLKLRQAPIPEQRACKAIRKLGYDIIHDARGWQVVQRFGSLVGEVVYTTDDPADALAFCQYEDSHP